MNAIEIVHSAVMKFFFELVTQKRYTIILDNLKGVDMFSAIKKLLLLLFISFYLIGQVDYNSQVQPIFDNSCTGCHPSSGGLNLSSYTELMEGGNSGDVISPGDHASSILYDRITRPESAQGDMPPTGSLSQNEIDLIAQWIDEGALETPASNEVTVTFQVDMTYQEVSELGVHIAGSFQGWDPSTSECTLVNDNIYSTSFTLTAGDNHEYKFINGNAWGMDESVQRNITVPEVDTVLDPVYFNDYVDVGGDSVFVTFNLNTSTGPGLTDSSVIVLRGSFNDWAGSDWQLLNTGGDYWTFTSPTQVEPGNYEYKYVLTDEFGDHWETLENRSLIVDGLSDVDLSMDYYDADSSPFTQTDSLDVWFRVSTAGILGYSDNTMYIAGSMNNWIGDPLTRESENSEFWSGQYSFAEEGEVSYKFQHGDGGWESISDRTATISNDTTIAWVYFNNEPPSEEETISAEVTLTCVVENNIYDDVRIKGQFNSWTNEPMTNDGEGNWTYTTELLGPASYEWGAVSCTPETCDPGGGDWLPAYADFPPFVNPTVEISADGSVTGDLSFTVPYLGEIITNTIIFSVDMTEWLDEPGSEGMPLFSVERGDNMQVRGGFNGWSDANPDISLMVREPGTNIFTLPVSVPNYQGSTVEYKFYIQHSEESIAYLESIYGPLAGGWENSGWEDSPQFGGGNRSFTMTMNNGSVQQLPIAGYYDLPVGAVVPEGQSLTLTFSIDMTNATTDDCAFVPGDPVSLNLKDRWMHYIGGIPHGTDGSHYPATDNGDGTYSVSVILDGPIPWHMIYAWEFENANCGLTQEGGGFGFGRFRARYFHQNDDQGCSWTDYAYPMDEWKKDPPLFVEEWDPDNICPGSSLSVMVNHLEGWNLVSIPLQVFDATYTSVYPDAVSGTLYGFDGTYNSTDVLESGNGYWLFFDSSGSDNIAGSPVNQVTVSLSEGWNLFGGLSSSLSTSSISDPEGIIISGSIYGFEGTYQNTSTIDPGKGYWINASGAGDITLSTGTAVRAIESFKDYTNEANIIRFNNFPLYFGASIPEGESVRYQLPPRPPQGSFDVRFAGDMKLIESNGTIELMNPYEETIISYQINHRAEMGFTWILKSSDGKEYPLNQSGEFLVNGNNQEFTLRKTSAIPSDFSLYQNFPNPFNPVTTIGFSIPENANISLSIYNVSGEKIIDLVNSQAEAGYYSVSWDGKSHSGAPASSGLYFYSLKSESFSTVKKMILMK